MIARATLQRFGFSPDRLSFSLRTAIAACCAVMLAWLVGLEHPQWSGMTAWAASQPVRGHLLEKSFFRAAGTVVGVLFGMLLLVGANGETWLIVVGLSFWIGLCAGAGNLVRGFVSYGALTAGYSAAMVSLLHSAHSASPLAVGVDRMLTVLAGVLVALAVGWMLAARGDTDDSGPRVRALSRRTLNDLAAHLVGTPPDREEHSRLLSEMAAIEDKLDGQAAGSLNSRQIAKAIRRLLTAQVAILLWMRRQSPAPNEGALASALRDASKALGEPDRPDIADVALLRAAGMASDPALKEAVTGFVTASAQDRNAVRKRPSFEMKPAVVLHRDWIGAREAFLRTAVIVFIVGAIWLVTGWEGGPFMLLGTTVMMTVFAAMDTPTVMLRYALIGQPAAVGAALICRWLIWPLADHEIWLVFGMMPFILVGGLLFAHQRTAGPAFDYNMVVMLLLQPTWPLTGTFAHFLTLGVAVVLAPLVGLVAFQLLFPVDGTRRMHALAAMMVEEIEAMAANRGASRRRAVWRARLYHRVLRLVRWADRTGGSKEEVIEGGFAVLMLGSAILHIDEVLQRPTLRPRTARRLNAVLARLRNVGGRPERAAGALAAAAVHLGADPDVNMDLLREAAAELSERAAFMRMASASRQMPAIQS